MSSPSAVLLSLSTRTSLTGVAEVTGGNLRVTVAFFSLKSMPYLLPNRAELVGGLFFLSPLESDLSALRSLPLEGSVAAVPDNSEALGVGGATPPSSANSATYSEKITRPSGTEIGRAHV